jgi:hypothetical protein
MTGPTTHAPAARRRGRALGAANGTRRCAGGSAIARPSTQPTTPSIVHAISDAIAHVITHALTRALTLTLAASPLAMPSAVPIHAQAPVAPAPARSVQDTASVHAEVRAVVLRLFDGMRARDTSAMRALLHPAATLLSSGERDGAPVVRADPVDGWLASIARAPDGTVLDERVLSQEVRVDGGLASVWAEYELWVGPRFSHCGVDAFLLGRTADGWRILSVADTRRRTGCRQPVPPR